MALDVQQIKEIIRAEKNLNPEVAPILFSDEGGSQTGTANLWAYLHALATNILSQLMDLFISEVNTIVLTNVPATPQWIKSKLFQFQKGDAVVLDTTTFAASYTIIDPLKRIVTQCSVRTDLNNTVNIKVAKGGVTPMKLSTTEIDEVTAYYAEFNPAGIRYRIISKDADLLTVKAIVYYDGQFSDVIKTTVIAAINAFMASIPFDGVMLVSDLEAAIKDVQGVNDVVLTDVWARAAETVFGSVTKLIDTSLLISRRWDTISGYMIGETTGGQTLNDTLTFRIDA